MAVVVVVVVVVAVDLQTHQLLSYSYLSIQQHICIKSCNSPYIDVSYTAKCELYMTEETIQT